MLNLDEQFFHLKTLVMKSITFCRKEYVPWQHLMHVMVFLFLNTVLFYPSQAQSPASSPPVYFSSHLPAPVFLRLNEIDRRAARHFCDHFPNALYPKWFRENKYYVVRFSSAHGGTKVYYLPNGNFDFFMSDYTAEDLDKGLKQKIQKTFPGYDIDCVKEVSDFEKTGYYIKIKSPFRIKTLHCLEGKMEVTEDLLNGSL